ncbi:MAG: hypothetical protein J6A77_11615 [Lachnospiraceae bacterium]|nr:hypothetical protein [Lachnospiraceae bacterium]
MNNKFCFGKLLDKNKSGDINILFYLSAYILIFALVCSVYPLYDDWGYLTAPNPDFSLSDLLPGRDFWRPFDALFGGFMGLIPGLFPLLNHVVVVLGHILNAVLLELILKEFQVKPGWRKFTVCYFLFSSATWAVTISSDGLNQAYSVLFGLVAVYIHLKRGGYSYLLWCAIALFWKENGISWFYVIPVLEGVVTAKTWKNFIGNFELIKQCVKKALLSTGAVVLYFLARFALYGSMTLGSGTGRYKMSLFSLSALKNTIMQFGSAGSGVDSIALLSNDKSPVLAGITIVLSLVFLGVLCSGLVSLFAKKQHIFPLLGIAVCALGLAFPTIIIDRASEMNAYPVLCAVAVLFGFCLDRGQVSGKKMTVAGICIFLAFFISSAHKLVVTYDYSERTQQLTENIREYYGTPSDTVLFVEIGAWEGYSVFHQTALRGTAYGASLRQYYSWEEVHHKAYSAKSEEDAAEYIQSHKSKYDVVLVIRGETVEKMK